MVEGPIDLCKDRTENVTSTNANDSLNSEIGIQQSAAAGKARNKMILISQERNVDLTSKLWGNQLQVF